MVEPVPPSSRKTSLQFAIDFKRTKFTYSELRGTTRAAPRRKIGSAPGYRALSRLADLPTVDPRLSAWAGLGDQVFLSGCLQPEVIAALTARRMLQLRPAQALRGSRYRTGSHRWRICLEDECAGNRSVCHEFMEALGVRQQDPSGGPMARGRQPHIDRFRSPLGRTPLGSAPSRQGSPCRSDSAGSVALVLVLVLPLPLP